MTSKSRLDGSVPSELLEENQVYGASVYEGQDPLPIEIPYSYSNQFGWQSDCFVPSDKPLLLEEFIELAGQVIANAQSNERKEEKIIYTGAHPAEDMHRLGDEVICWKVVSRSPARTGRNKSGNLMPQWQHSHSLRIPDAPNTVISVERRLVDHVISFECWSKTARLANARVLWLERLLINSAWVFRQKGADFFQWKDRLADTYQLAGGARLYNRTLRFDVRLPEFRISGDPAINNFVIEGGPDKDVFKT